MSSTFNSQFLKVFSEDLSVKPCGRLETTELIKLCKEIKMILILVMSLQVL